jgi:dTDP-4-amino-4,6-dideoxygalactose transaminase
MSASTIEPCITDRTRAILCVHKTGVICDMDPINELAAKHGLIVYEDACQAVFGEYKGRLAGALSDAAAFSFDSEKTMGADIGGCLVTNDDRLAEQARFIGQSRGGVKEPGFGRKHVEAGYAFRMPHCTAAICLAQLEIIRDQVTHRDRMYRLMSKLIGEIPGIFPLAIPDYVNVYSPWMFSMNIDPEQFCCTTEEFAKQLVDRGVPNAGTGKYYLMPVAAEFLQRNARKKVYPYCAPPASREYRYGVETCPNAWDFLQTWIRWATFCEKYTEKYCRMAKEIVEEVADENRR